MWLVDFDMYILCEKWAIAHSCGDCSQFTLCLLADTRLSEAASMTAMPKMVQILCTIEIVCWQTHCHSTLSAVAKLSPIFIVITWMQTWNIACQFYRLRVLLAFFYAIRIFVHLSNHTCHAALQGVNKYYKERDWRCIWPLPGRDPNKQK